MAVKFLLIHLIHVRFIMSLICFKFEFY
jgi:hypothetical protein